jgi:hypothetical protein
MRSLAFVFGLLTGAPAMAYMTTTDKPDPYAHKHYSAKAIPKKAAKSKAKIYSDAEIQAEIAAEHAGRPEPVKPVLRKPTAAVQDIRASRVVHEMDTEKAAAPVEKKIAAPTEYESPAPSASAGSFPKVVVCKFSVQPEKQRYGKGLISSRYLVSDSDGFEACNDYGGEIIAGNDQDRGLLNVKDSALLRHSKK